MMYSLGYYEMSLNLKKMKNNGVGHLYFGRKLMMQSSSNETICYATSWSDVKQKLPL